MFSDDSDEGFGAKKPKKTNNLNFLGADDDDDDTFVPQ